MFFQLSVQLRCNSPRLPVLPCFWQLPSLSWLSCLCLTCHSPLFSPLCFRKRRITWHTCQRLVTVIYEQGAPLMSRNRTVPSRRQTLCHLVSRDTNISKNAELNTFKVRNSLKSESAENDLEEKIWALESNAPGIESWQPLTASKLLSCSSIPFIFCKTWGLHETE